MNPLDDFANEARRFCNWAKTGAGSGSGAARTALQRLVALYAAGLELPDFWSVEPTDDDPEDVPEAEMQTVIAKCENLPINLYLEVYDPVEAVGSTRLPEPVGGALSDDISDIYLDVTRGLQEYDAGRTSSALWEWSLQFRHHWGAHATSAIRALDWWLRHHPAD